jgi:hypothetical protein
MLLDFLQNLVSRVLLSYHAFTENFGWRLQNEMNRKVRRIGGSLISTVQVRALSSYPKSAAERHTDLPATTLAQIRQFYRRHASLCDGEKFLHVRFYEREKNYAVASKWKRLLGTKAKSLHQVLRNKWLRDCLEKLETFRSLWMGFQLGSFPLILSWRCRQVRLP